VKPDAQLRFDKSLEVLALVWAETMRQLSETQVELEAGKIQWAAVKANADKACEENKRLLVIEKLARDFTADYAGDPDDHEYEEVCVHRFHALKAAIDAKPEGEG